MPFGGKVREDGSDLFVHEAPVAEVATGLADIDDAGTAGPWVHVLKEKPVKLLQMFKAEVARD